MLSNTRFNCQTLPLQPDRDPQRFRGRVVNIHMSECVYRVLTTELSVLPFSQDLDDIEDENEQLKQENKTLLKVVGQLTR